MIPLRIAISDDHRVVGRSLQAYLESFPEFSVVGIAASGEQLLSELEEWKPDIVLQDLLLPGGIDGVETTRRVLQRSPQTRVIAVTASVDEARLMAVLRCGAAGYVRKDADPETLVAALRAVAAGKTYIDPSVSRQLLRGNAEDDLTAREREVLRALALGRSNRQIASMLQISEETVKTHVAHLLAKLEVENRAQAIVQSLKRGILSLEELDR
jgi:two-component system, NarL family, response regulator LiaR